MKDLAYSFDQLSSADQCIVSSNDASNMETTAHELCIAVMFRDTIGWVQRIEHDLNGSMPPDIHHGLL